MDEVLRRTVEVLHDRFEHYSWVGIYLVEGDDLVLGPWKWTGGDRARANPGRPGHLWPGSRDRAHGGR